MGRMPTVSDLKRNKAPFNAQFKVIQTEIPESDKEARSRIIQENICKSKYAYLSKSGAKKHGGQLGNRPYKCPICRLWHLTSQKKTERAKNIKNINATIGK